MAFAMPISTDSESRPKSSQTDRIDRAIAATRAEVPVALGDDGSLGVPKHTLLYYSFSYFMSEVHDDHDHEMLVEPHTEEWCDLFQYEPLLVLMAPRDHGKSVCGRCYVLWRAWKHNRDPETGQLLEGNPEGRYEVVIFSETIEQATEWFEIWQGNLLGNPELFADLAPDRRLSKTALANVWSKRRARLRNGFEAKVRSWRTSTRGLHPDLIILDDVLSDQNTLTKYQRDKSWTYFVGTLMPMNASEMKVVGTALHQEDLLHRLKPDKTKAPLMIRNRPARFRWVKYRSVNWATGKVLWERQHSLADLTGRRDQDALLFAREYQNDPIDDSSSLFPFDLTDKALQKGKHLTFLSTYHPAAGEYVLLGMDLAASEAVGADFTVCWVAKIDWVSQHLTLLFGHREKGMSFEAQLNLLRNCCSNYGVDIGVVEENGFQRWLYAETLKYPETAGKLIGHRTGREKATITEGVPSMKITLLQEAWTFPSGDQNSRRLAAIWQAEMAAYGWKDDKLQGVGEHDDTVMAWWFLDRARRELYQWLTKPPDTEVVAAADVGIAPVIIGADY